MPRIYVEFARMKSFTGTCKNISGKIENIRSDFQRTVSQLDWDVKYEQDISNTAGQLVQKMDRYVQALKKYQSFLEDAYSQYEKLDSEKYPDSLIGSNVPWEDILKTISDLLFISSPKLIPIASWHDRFSARFNNSLKLPTVIEAIISVTFNTYDNFWKEENGFGRSLAETISETIIDVAKGVAVGATAAGVVAAIGLSGPVGWCVIAGLSIGGGIALDKVIDTEKWSDTILDSFALVGSKGKDMVSAISNTLQNITNCYNQPIVQGGGAAW